jgi:signal transduction histidine kinase
LFTRRQLAIAVAIVVAVLLGIAAWNIALHRVVKRRTRSLEAANRSLRQAIQLKDEVVAIVAHDFRSPLTLIQGHSEYLQERVDNEKARQELRVISDTAMQLAELAEDTLTMSRIESGILQLKPEPMILNEVLQAVVAARGGISGRDVRLDLPETPVRVIGDSGRLHEVVDNLLDNAIKYSSEDEPVLVKLRETAQEAEVSVENQGPPITAEEQARLFRKFSRLESALKRKIPGTGLGLFICRSLVEAHGGRIWAKSDGEGTAFHFAVPLAGGDPRPA